MTAIPACSFQILCPILVFPQVQAKSGLSPAASAEVAAEDLNRFAPDFPMTTTKDERAEQTGLEVLSEHAED